MQQTSLNSIIKTIPNPSLKKRLHLGETKNGCGSYPGLDNSPGTEVDQIVPEHPTEMMAGVENKW